MQQKNTRKVVVKFVYIFEFFCSENLFNCIALLSRDIKTAKIKSDLYVKNKKYRLILYADKSQKSVLVLASEFADNVFLSLKELNTTKEYKLITMGNATEKIGKVL